MDNKTLELTLKLKDYQRFVSTLIILSCYLYMGALINLYLRPSGHGMTFIYLTIASVLSSIVFLYRYKKLQIKVNENEHV